MYGKNAIVSSIKDSHMHLKNKYCLAVGSRIAQVHGLSVHGWKHQYILDRMHKVKERPVVLVFGQVK